MKATRSALLISFALVSSGCAGAKMRGADSLSLSMPDNDLTAVQHTRDPEARRTNVLYLPARAITMQEFGRPELSSLLARMRALMHSTGGIGIAANQVGKQLQVFMIEAKPNNPRYQVLGEVPYQAFINPRIVAASIERRNFWHGCLSAVGEKRGNVATYEWIDVEAADEAGIVRRSRLGGLAAVIFQHELRHLLGGTYLDKATTFLDKAELDEKLDAKALSFFDRVDGRLPLLLDDYRVGETLEEYYGRRSL
ncbi:MAG: peptide deformylase [Proteobacteria bacterium]|nr:MAG: peptide deformylase [Pseudomonadota bacterium]